MYKKTNLVQAEKFSDEEVIKELIEMAKNIAASEEKADELGLTKEEKAFYDALTKPRAVKTVIRQCEQWTDGDVTQFILC